MKRALLAAAVALTACNSGQPRIYRVAINLSSSSPVQDGSCYKNQQVPVPQVQQQNVYSEQQWVIWDSVTSESDPSQKQFLDFGHQTFTLGDSPTVEFSDLIGSTDPGMFDAQRVKNSTTQVGNGSYVQARQTEITVHFSDLGAAPGGELVIDSKYLCQGFNGVNCPKEEDVQDPRNCRLSIPFSARRIDVSRVTGYSETGSEKGTTSAPNI